jgi:hypothetical protein
MDTQQLIQKLSAEGPKKPLRRPLFTWGLFLLCLFGHAVLALSLSGLRVDLVAKWQDPTYIMTLLGMLSIGVLAAWLTTCLALPDGNQQSGFWRRSVLLLCACVAAVLAYSWWHMGSHVYALCSLLGDYVCAVHVVLSSLTPLMVMLYMIRKAAPLQILWVGAMAGLAAASFAYVVLQLTLVGDSPVHLFVWHFLPVLGVAMGGGFLGRYLFRYLL